MWIWLPRHGLETVMETSQTKGPRPWSDFLHPQAIMETNHYSWHPTQILSKAVHLTSLPAMPPSSSSRGGDSTPCPGRLPSQSGTAGETPQGHKKLPTRCLYSISFHSRPWTRPKPWTPDHLGDRVFVVLHLQSKGDGKSNDHKDQSRPGVWLQAARWLQNRETGKFSKSMQTTSQRYIPRNII